MPEAEPGRSKRLGGAHRALQQPRPGVQVPRSRDDERQSVRDRGRPGVGVAGGPIGRGGMVVGLRAVREGVHRRPDRLAHRQVERQLGVVDRGARHRVRVGATALASRREQDPEVGRPLRTRVRRGHGDDRRELLGSIFGEGRHDRLARVDGAPATERDEPVRRHDAERGGRAGDGLDGDVRTHAVERADHRQRSDRGGATRRRDEQRATDADLGAHVRERRERPRAEPDDRCHGASLARAKATNASATREGERPAARAREISRRTSIPSTATSARRPAASSCSTDAREMKVMP